MQIIPVMDIKSGLAVHARRGDRSNYQSLCTPLCPSSDPIDVVSAYLGLHAFSVMYVADLDAITGTVPQTRLVRRLARLYPTVEFWVDAGWPVEDDVDWVPVIGSESLDSGSWDVAKKRFDRWILSLDFRNGGFMGAAEILDQPSDWPDRVIHMNLNRVGSGDGPDVVGLRQILDLVSGS